MANDVFSAPPCNATATRVPCPYRPGEFYESWLDSTESRGAGLGAGITSERSGDGAAVSVDARFRFAFPLCSLAWATGYVFMPAVG